MSQLLFFDINIPFYNIWTISQIYYIVICSFSVDNVILKDNAYYGQDEDPAYYTYDSLISRTYKGTSTVFFQDLAMKKYDVKKVIVFPSTPSTFNQAVIDKTKFRLKVFYSKL